MNDTNLENIPTTPWQYFKVIMKPHRWVLISAILLVVVASALDQTTSYLFKMIVDAVSSGNTTRVFWLGLSFPFVLFVVQMLFRISGFLVMNLSANTKKDGYDFLFTYASKHSQTYFANRFAGGVHSKMRNVVEGLDSIIPDFIWTYVYSTSALLVTFGFILSVDTLSAVIFVVLVLFLMVINYKTSHIKEEASKKSAEAKTSMNGKMLDMLSNMSTVRQYARTKFELSLVKTTTEEMRRTSLKSWLISEYLLVVNSIVLLFFSALMFWLLANRWSEGLVTTGEFVLIASLVTQLSGTLLFIGRAFNSTARTIGEMKEGLSDLMINHEILDDSILAKKLETSGGEIVWHDVDFTYGDTKIFDKFNLVIPAGQRVGLVGQSGAGKSTFVALLLRLHDIQSGEITIDKQNIKLVTQDSLREAIAVVPQEPSLFHRTIRDNIAYGKEGATDNEIESVAKRAYAHDFIMNLEKGYQTLVGERGIKLSGGQKQRVAIARAMIKESPILVLDEATSALDSESEVEIQRALHTLMAGKTVLAVAHRLSTLREMDRIIVLDKGKIVEDGNHDSLVAFGGIYAKLWNHQAGGFLNE